MTFSRIHDLHLSQEFIMNITRPLSPLTHLQLKSPSLNMQPLLPFDHGQEQSNHCCAHGGQYRYDNPLFIYSSGDNHVCQMCKVLIIMQQ